MAYPPYIDSWQDLTEEDIRRFWQKVDQGGGPSSCWEWRGARGGPRRVYGVWGIAKSRTSDGRGRTFNAYALAYRLTYGELPDGHVVRHTCDNGLCCNPAHLQSGTVAENNEDMVRRGRAWWQRYAELQAAGIVR